MICILLFATTTAIATDDDSGEKQEKALRIVPLVTSTPLTGTGVGAAGSCLYKANEDSATLQLQAGAHTASTLSFAIMRS